MKLHNKGNLQIGDRIKFKLSGEAGEIKYSAIIKKDILCGDGAIGSWGVAVVNPVIERTGILTDRKISWFGGLFYDYWVCLTDNGALIKLDI